MTTVDAKLLREVMGGFATGVAVITTAVGDESHGMTVNSLTSVSLDPPLLLVCLTRDSRTAKAVAERGAFVVNLLATRQATVSDRFAKRGVDHFAMSERSGGTAGSAVGTSARGLPVLERGLGWLDCDVEEIHHGGDHIIVVGNVLSCEARPGTPLVFFRGRYHKVTDTGREAHFEWYW